jgi:uncharacterized protein
MATIGTYNTLTTLAVTPTGAFLDGAELGEILLPLKEVPSDLNVGNNIEVFVYHDSMERVLATLIEPKVQVNQFASLRVQDTNRLGAFVDWGLDKDLLVPKKEQHKPMEVGKHYVVRVYEDNLTGRLAASSKIDKFIDVWPAEYQEGQEVDLLVAARTDLGFKAIINHLNLGLLYNNEIFKKIRVGQKMKGYIKHLREDGRIDLTLTRSGRGKVVDFKEALLQYITEQGGQCNLHDKSSPEEIKDALGVSKKTFKATVGHLLKQKKIELIPNGIKVK